MTSFNPFQIFNNPFNMEDLAIFDDSTLRRLQGTCQKAPSL